LVWAEPTDLLGEAVQQATQHNQQNDDRLNIGDIIRAAAELKGHQMVLPDLVKLELASRIGYADLPDDVREQVDRVREAANPKTRAAQLASDLLQQWRGQSQQSQAA
jgi:hypothetical protein